MSVRLLKLVTSAILIAAAGSIAIPTPASAQRWREIVNNRHMEGKLDMESLRWEGSTVTYQVVYLKVQPGSDAKRTVLATSEMNCETRQRRMVADETVLPDGTPAQKGTGGGMWRPIDDNSLTGTIEQIVCAKTR